MATHGSEATFSLNPPGSFEIHSNDAVPKNGLSGFGTKYDSRSTPGALFRHMTDGLIQPRCPKLDAVADSSGDRIAMHTSAATAAVGACATIGIRLAMRDRTTMAIQTRRPIISVSTSTGV